jgi:hypothetical protein
MFTHARHCRFGREKERLFTKRIIWILLRQNLKLGLCVCEILVPVINLR